ncbi:DUF2231 domain-containing protein [Sulfurovum sp.]|uniref:DUF2231 domain-containing protein n=1 Tax=Sulfurovum sp. TaxID=1969726 RepID=UPI0025E52E88|nr:DUF2231 domain-containing protein [Sulfurovum sp.]
MELPALKLPQVELPFDIATLLHPPVDHFVIAIPILVLIIEIINLFAKKKAIGVISFILLIIGMVAAIAAYFTGLHDGKEAFDALTQAGQTELKAHKLLGTYLMLASAIVVIFKLLSALIQRGLMKALYLLVLIVFIAGILKQGKDGGELVYEYGANVERVQDLDSDLFDANEELDDLKEKMKAASEKAQEKVEAVKETVSHAAQDAAAKTSQTVENVKEKAAEAVENVKKNTSAAVDSLKEKVSEATPAAEPAATEAAPAADTASAAEENTTAAQ